MTSLRPLLIVPLLTMASLALACTTPPGTHRGGLQGDGSVSDPCAAEVCEAGQHCELVATPCAPDSPECERVAVCVDDAPANACDTEVCEAGQHCELVATPCAPGPQACEPVPVCVLDELPTCTPDDCGPQPPTLPCADESPSQSCERDAQGACGWLQLDCPLVGDPCVGCQPCPIPEFGECQWTEVGVCSQVSASCV